MGSLRAALRSSLPEEASGGARGGGRAAARGCLCEGGGGRLRPGRTDSRLSHSKVNRLAKPWFLSEKDVKQSSAP